MILWAIMTAWSLLSFVFLQKIKIGMLSSKIIITMAKICSAIFLSSVIIVKNTSCASDLEKKPSPDWKGGAAVAERSGVMEGVGAPGTLESGIHESLTGGQPGTVLILRRLQKSKSICQLQ